MPKICGLKSQVVLKYELICIMKHNLVHKQVVLSQRLVSQHRFHCILISTKRIILKDFVANNFAEDESSKIVFCA